MGSRTISVIIPTYNHRDYVLETLGSVFAQTFADYEVIVVNDGSPDDTAELLRPLADAGRLRYIEQPNAGQAAARNRGLAEARGKFVAFLDDDDIWPADKLEWQVGTLAANPGACAVAGTLEYINEAGEVFRRGRAFTLSEVSFRSLFASNPITSPGQTLVSAEVLRANGGFDERVWGADDYELWLRLAAHGRVLLDRRIALRYRLHPDNASRNKHRMLANCVWVVRRYLRQLPEEDRAAAARDAYQWIYRYAGRAVVSDVRRSARQLRFVKTLESLWCAKAIIRPAMGDASLRGHVIRDVMPASLRRRLTRRAEVDV